MKKFVILTYGFTPPTTKFQRAWGEWFKSAGPHLADPGSPFGHGVELTRDGRTELTLQSPSPLVGYCIINARQPRGSRIARPHHADHRERARVRGALHVATAGAGNGGRDTVTGTISSVGERGVAEVGGVGDLAGAEVPPRDQVLDGEGNPAAGARVVSGRVGVVPLDPRGS